MAKRKTVQEKQIESLIEKHLNELGRRVSVMAARNSRVRTGDLRDSQNYQTKPYNVLTVSQNWYGKDQFLKGKNSGEKNALKVTIDKYSSDGVKILVKDMIDLLASPVQFKK